MIINKFFRNKFTIVRLLSLVFICFCSAYLFISCEKEDFSGDPKYLLEFSVDTLDFQTVFSDLKSSTQKMIIFNPHKKSLRISKISLMQGNNSPFQLNIDGQSNENNLFSNIELPSKDFIFVFVALKSKEQSTNDPTPIEEHILLETNGNTQKIVLRAVAQNSEKLNSVKVLNDTILTADKPYVIYDSLYVAPEKTLKLMPGCRLYFHNNAKLAVYGNIIAEGTKDQPIEMRGDRFDNMNFSTPLPYNYVSAQWDGIYLYADKGENVFKHVNINSAYVGIYFDNKTPISTTQIPRLLIQNSRIHNFQFYGLYIHNVDANVVNSELSNTGYYTVYLSGGKHEFVHTTIANYFNNGVSIQAKGREYDHPALMIKESPTNPTDSRFFNTVIAGSRTNELLFESSSNTPDNFQFYFTHSYLQTTENKDLTTSFFNKVLWSNYPEKHLFKNNLLSWEEKKKEYYNFEPDSISPIRKLGSLSILDSIPFAQYELDRDLNGADRSKDGTPDAGAYQYFSK